MIRKFIQKQKIKRLFGKLVTSEEVERILRDGFQSLPHRHGRIEFVVTYVRDESQENVSKRISRVTDIAIAHRAVNHGIIGALAIVAFGTHPTSVPKAENRLSLIKSLRQELARDIKIVHGAADGQYGIFGTFPAAYSFLVPQFDQVLGMLSQLDFGEATEYIPRVP